FGANMTGNTIVFAVSLYRDARHAIFPLTLIVAFLLGAMLGRAIVARFSPSIALVCEAVLLGAAAFVPNASALGVIALAMGIQNTAFATFAGVRANTSFLSGDYTNLGRALADLVIRDKSDENPSAISILAPVIAAYVAGAVLAVFCRSSLVEVLVVVPIVLVIAYAASRRSVE
ncbi:MAG: DUF1275 domain-containing protein, partial [Candidatus Eremiobacteraeota bacterium]|nr:DUF1275 domain-containing protein [Candidatus Eremiobacteraeota bacterium]